MSDSSVSLRVLIVDDSPEDRALYRRLIAKAGQCECAIREVGTGQEGLALYRKDGCDCILLDYCLPDLSGLEFLDKLADEEVGLSTSVIMLTGEGTEFVASEAMERGAQDYLVKADLTADLLSRTIRYATHRQHIQGQNRTLIENLASRNKEILQLAYAMTHDLQTPLASLTGTIDVLERHIGNLADEKTRTWLSRINQSVDRMTTMLDDLMTYARAGNEEIKVQCVEAEEVIDQILLEMIENASAKNVTFDVRRPLPSVAGDPTQIYRIFANLIGNAVKYAPANGGISVVVSGSIEGHSARFEIRDNGPGIDPGFLKKVFLPFKRATHKKAGSGIGLATVLRMVEQHAGRVWLESDGESGTTAFVELPTACCAHGAPEVVAV
jgi:signal transduction histidine kinase